jgi:hypothetical protein
MPTAQADAQPGPGAVARVIEYAPGRLAALPPHTTLEIIENPQAIPVPGAAYYGWGLLTWQGRRLPMIDLEALVRAYPGARHATVPRYALVVAYQRAPGLQVEHGAIGLMELPQAVVVCDESYCDLPGNSDVWPVISLSCFSLDGQPIPIMDTAALFSSYHG